MYDVYWQGTYFMYVKLHVIQVLHTTMHLHMITSSPSVDPPVSPLTFFSFHIFFSYSI